MRDCPSSLATGAKLTQETFSDFVERLHFHNRGEGVKRHITANPIFMVQKHATIYGLADDCCEAKIVHFDDYQWDSPQEYWDDADDGEQSQLNSMAQGMWERDFLDCESDEQWMLLDDLDNHTVSGIRKEWQHVNAHLTREAAEAFIARKQHDYPPLRVYVESMCYGWEYNEIISALLDGRLVLKGGDHA